ncbi:MAG: RsiG family protein [Sporichthyaceae bacterium]
MSIARQRTGGSMSENTKRPRRGVLEPAAAPQLAELTLAQLRSYRRDLQEEEEKVSYWRRLVHARLDLLTLGANTEGSLTLDQLIRVLGDTGTGASRNALSAVHSSDPLPDLPESRWMWVTEIDPHDGVALAEAVGRLKAAEEKLTSYRKALFERIDTATADLIARYQANPAAALTALPD